MCHADRNWTNSLLTVMLGLRTNVLDSGASPAEFLYGTTLRVPGEFVLSKSFGEERYFFLEEFREHMRSIKPVPVEHHHKRKISVSKDLVASSHVFLKIGPKKKSLECPYSGKLIKF